MRIYNRLALLRVVVLVLALAAVGCSSGTKLLSVSAINGPGFLDERRAADYSVTVHNNTDVSFTWAVDPASAGSFTNLHQAGTTFHAGEVTVNTPVEIPVSITGTQAEPTVVTRQVTIVDTNQAPIAAAHSDKNRIGDGQEIRFFDDSTDPEGDDDIVTWEWDFDFDADTGFDPDSEEMEPSHQFDVPGNFRVQLRVTDRSAITDMLDTALSIEVVENVAPVITLVNHARTTSEAGNVDEAVDLEVIYEDHTPPGGPHNIIWSCDYGYFDDYTSRTPRWFPPNDVLECDISVDVIDEFGLADSGSVHQWMTSLPTINNQAAPDNVIVSQSLDTAFNGTVNPADFSHPNDTADGNVILLSFWATWSGSSVKGMALLLDLYALYSSEADYVHFMTNVGDSKQQVTDFVTENSYEGPHWLLDLDTNYFTLTNGWCGDSNILPQTLVFDRDGRCRLAYVGQLTDLAEMQSAIEELL